MSELSGRLLGHWEKCTTFRALEETRNWVDSLMGPSGLLLRSSLPPICNPSFIFVVGGVAEKFVAGGIAEKLCEHLELGCEKYFCRFPYSTLAETLSVLTRHMVQRGNLTRWELHIVKDVTMRNEASPESVRPVIHPVIHLVIFPLFIRLVVHAFGHPGSSEVAGCTPSL